MADTEITDEELDPLANAWPDVTGIQWRRLVAALRSAWDDTRIANERGDAWREQVKEDTLTIESRRAELERERTQNRELRALVMRLAIDAETCVASGPECEQGCFFCAEDWRYNFLKGRYDETHAENCVWVNAQEYLARAALSTQEPARDPLDIKTGSAGWATRCETYSVTGFRCDKQAGHLDAHESTHGSEATCWLNLAVARGEALLSTQEESK